MSIVKSKHASNYTVLPNEIFKAGLSLNAIGLLSYLLSLPHDWVIYKTTLHTQLNVGRERLDTAFKELQEIGFIITIKEVDSNGRFTYNHIVYDKPYNGEPYTGNPNTVDPTLQSTKLPSTNILNKDTNEKTEFDLFWDMYDKKVGDKDKLRKKFNKLPKESREKIFSTLPNYLKSTEDKQYRKNPSTYLNNSSWNDEIIFNGKPLTVEPERDELGFIKKKSVMHT